MIVMMIIVIFHGKCGNGGNDDYEADDDIYIMVKCVYVTFLLILPSPCKADDIFIMVECLSVCMSRLSHRHVPSLPCLSESSVSYTFDYKPLQFQHIMMIMIIMNIMID